MPALTEIQRVLARQALGLNSLQRRSNRNQFRCVPSSPQYTAWARMVLDGNAVRLDDPIAYKIWTFELTEVGALQAVDVGEALCPKAFPEWRELLAA